MTVQKVIIQDPIKRWGNFSYIGNVSHSSKHSKALSYGELTYSIYLAPANLSGHEVCPGRNEECTTLCLYESGQNRIDSGKIANSRIQKTKMFYENRELFMANVVGEIIKHRAIAEVTGNKFSVRLNNTSDLSPEVWRMKFQGIVKNILQIFPDVQFYDYTKVYKRLDIAEKYGNYDLTFSYSGTNWDECLSAIDRGFRVAVVFENEIPSEWRGIRVINGDLYDMRYHDDPGVIVGLKYKAVRNKRTGNESFIVKP